LVDLTLAIMVVGLRRIEWWHKMELMK
jgi:hypothetical protein